MMHTRLQNHTNMVVGEYEILTFDVVVVLLLFLFDILVPQLKARPLLYLDK